MTTWCGRLRSGDESAFAEVVRRLPLVNGPSGADVRLEPAVAEEVTQDTWLAVLKGIGRFEGRSSLKTWIFRILSNRARSTGRARAAHDTCGRLR